MHLKVVGYENRIRVLSPYVKARVEIWGCDNTLEIEEGCEMLPDAFICIGAPDCPAHHCRLHIGRNGSFKDGFEIRLMENGSEVTIGEECLTSDRVQLWCTDSHAILQDGKVINIGRSISVGNHVWLGMDVKMSKNSGVGNNCIVGWGSVVTRTYTEDNCILAGCPASIVKRGVEWTRERPNSFARAEEEYPGFRIGGDARGVLGRVQLQARLLCYRFKSCLYSSPGKRQKYRRLIDNVQSRLMSGK